MLLRQGDRSARGQVVVIVAVALTALVAMAGLVIDGGLAWSNRRQLQNAADSAALAGTRVLGLDLKWRATGSTGTPPFADPDTAVCDAINEALVYNTNSGQTIDAIDCYTGSPDAVYVDFDHVALGQVGNGVPFLAQGVRVAPNSQQETLLMRVVGISTVDIGADATALAGPAEPPLGLLMPCRIRSRHSCLARHTRFAVRARGRAGPHRSHPTPLRRCSAARGSRWLPRGIRSQKSCTLLPRVSRRFRWRTPTQRRSSRP
jgi:hypothetical protein